jgi:hypothetical protein
MEIRIRARALVMLECAKKDSDLVAAVVLLSKQKGKYAWFVSEPTKKVRPLVIARETELPGRFAIAKPKAQILF